MAESWDDLESYRPELVALCYRMTGSAHEAEDLVQETYLRAWRARASFEARSAVRTWLYRIAMNVCLTALNGRGRRVLPAGLGTPGEDPDVPLPAAQALWLTPWFGDPAHVAEQRGMLRLALVASAQHLPPRQRAAFLLREVLAMPATEIAEVLGTSVPAVKSALQRARSRLDELAPSPEEITEPDSPAARDILNSYISAFETADMVALTRLLRDDATLEVIPSGLSLSGKRSCVPFLAEYVLTAPGLYRMFPTVANDQPAAVAYYRARPDAPFRPFGLAVLTSDTTHLVSITTFLDPELVAAAGFPDDPGRMP
ncbi:RNA polymerase sigma-70 factor [Amycolatopsis camponoti]|uniref:RNA polymerase sigma factor n=1 Tax=Amycolatopsis camponoti TaxID=2606593 RepID=A0A6I8M1R3_9PSEU|nr:RNA polymerase subunit sigma-70 [Amycolatopsis camponoti]VVJ21934.1 RNA polymerase sigma-70 factor [Amycolatopsis camponoti]